MLAIDRQTAVVVPAGSCGDEVGESDSLSDECASANTSSEAKTIVFEENSNTEQHMDIKVLCANANPESSVECVFSSSIDTDFEKLEGCIKAEATPPAEEITSQLQQLQSPSG